MLIYFEVECALYGSRSHEREKRRCHVDIHSIYVTPVTNRFLPLLSFNDGVSFHLKLSAR